MENLPPLVELNPVAHPTDQFAPKPVRRSLGNYQAVQLGKALGSVSRDAEDVANNLFDVFNQKSEQAGHNFAELHADALKNQSALKDAVAAGQIPMADNPWFMVGVKQNVARREAQVGMTGILNDLRSDPVYHQDDPQQVDAYIRTKMAPMFQGKDQWEQSAMAGEADQYRQRILNDWTEQRRQERVDEGHASATALIRGRIDDWSPGLALSAGHGDPDAQRRIDGMVAYTQHELQNLGRVVDWPTANQWVSEAVLQASRDHRDPSLAQQVLDGLKGADGTPLSKTASNRSALQILPREIEQLNLMDARTGNEMRQQQAVADAQKMVQTAQDKWMKEQNVTSLMDVRIPASELGQHSELALQEFEKMQAQAASDWKVTKDSQFLEKLNPLTADAYKKAATGEWQNQDYLTFGSAMSLLGEPGRTALEGLTRFLTHMRTAKDGTTTPESLATLNKAYQSGTLNTDMVLKLREDGKLSTEDAGRWINMATAAMTEGPKGNPAVQQTLSELENLVNAKALAGGILPSDKPQLAEKVDQAKAAFLQSYYGQLVKSDGWDKLSFTEQRRQMDELRDSVSTMSGGVTNDQWLKEYQQLIHPRPEFIPKESPLTEKPPTAQEAKQQAEVDPFAGFLTKQTLSSARSALAVQPDAKTSDVVSATYGPVDTSHLGRPEFNALENFRNQSYTIEHGIPEDVIKRPPAIDRLVFGDTTPSQYETTHHYFKVSIRDSGDQLGEFTGKALDEESRLYQQSMAHLQALKPDAVQARDTVARLTAEYNRTGKITPQEQQQLRESLITSLAFQDLRDQVGYSTEEVKQMGEGAWTRAPMFANGKDLKQRGPEVMKQLGVKDFEAQLFYDAQLRLMQKIRENGSKPVESWSTEVRPLFPQQ